MSRTPRLRAPAIFLTALVALTAALFSGDTASAGIDYNVTKLADTADGACDADCSLREAVIAANASPGADTITLPAGTYVLTRTGGDDSGHGDLNVTSSVAIIGAGSTDTVIDAGGIDRALRISLPHEPPKSVEVSGLTVRNGDAEGDGGGIKVSSIGAEVVLSDVVVEASAAGEEGGGISVAAVGGTLTLDGVTVTGNGAAGDGGGINIATSSATLALTDVTVTGNTSGGSGGGVYTALGSTAALTLTNVTLSSNSAAGVGGGLALRSSGSFSADGLTVADNAAGGDGGGIFVMSNEEMTLASATVTGNSAAGDGGGVAAKASSLTILGSDISDNTAESDGGGIAAVIAALSVEDTVIQGNVARGSDGGGLATNAAGGGGISAKAAALELTRVSLRNNSAEAAASAAAAVRGGGGLALYGSATVDASTFSGNTSAESGGGIAYRGIVSLTNSTVSGNSATGPGGRGGGVFSAAGAIDLRNATVTANTAPDGGEGIDVTLPPPEEDPDGLEGLLANSIVAGNGEADCAGDFISLGHNLDGDGTCGLDGPGDVSGADPLLGPLADNGGPTQTHALLRQSPAIDAGDAGGCADPEDVVLAADQRGFARPVDGDKDGDAVCDIGAFEYEFQFPHGDVDCDGDVDTVDALKVLRHVAGLSVSQNEPCQDVGTGTPVFGDIDCDSDVDSVDSLRILRYVAGLPNNLPPGCGPIEEG